MSASDHLDRLADALDRRVRTEQIRVLYAQAPLGALAGLLIAPLLVFAVWEALPRAPLLVWLLALETTILIRLGLTLAFHRRSDPAETESWAARYRWACAASGACWGGCALLLALSPSAVYETFIALMLGGVLMGGVFTLSAVFGTYLLYALLLGLPPTLWLLAQSDPMRVVMGVCGLLYVALALTTAWRFHETLRHSLRLAAENLSLAQSFAKAKEQAETTNRHLTDQQAALRDSVEAMRELHQVISTPRRHARERIQAILAMGRQRFGMAFGVLCHIAGERYEVVEILSPGQSPAQGDVLALGDTYCRDTLRALAPLGFEHAAATPWARHPCYVKFRLESYLGAPVRLGKQVYGVLSFSDFQPRAVPFTAVDRELIQLMAQWVGGALEQERMIEAARRQQTLLTHASRLNTLGEMASGLAHEINQPITAITLYAETGLRQLGDAAPDSAAARETLEKIVAQGARANAIVQRIRHFARQGNPQYTLTRVPQILEDITDFLNLEASRHRLDLRYAIAPDLPWVRADVLQVQQVILNLARNAMDAMSAHAGSGLQTLTLSARAVAQEVVVAVRDSGPGLAPNAIDHVLHPFFTTKPDGLGLGLSISQSIVEAHGGRLWAAANRDGGATFHFALPVADGVAVPDRAVDALALDIG